MGSALMTEASAFISNHMPNAMIAMSGNNFSTVVTICTPPASRAPRQFTRSAPR